MIYKFTGASGKVHHGVILDEDDEFYTLLMDCDPSNMAEYPARFCYVSKLGVKTRSGGAKREVLPTGSYTGWRDSGVKWVAENLTEDTLDGKRAQIIERSMSKYLVAKHNKSKD